jgi:hypothetical protein
MRYQVDLRYSSVSFTKKDFSKAISLFKKEGLRLRRCMSSMDPGEVIDGLPLTVNLAQVAQA